MSGSVTCLPSGRCECEYCSELWLPAARRTLTLLYAPQPSSASPQGGYHRQGEGQRRLYGSKGGRGRVEQEHLARAAQPFERCLVFWRLLEVARKVKREAAGLDRQAGARPLIPLPCGCNTDLLVFCQ